MSPVNKKTKIIILISGIFVFVAILFTIIGIIAVYLLYFDIDHYKEGITYINNNNHEKAIYEFKKVSNNQKTLAQYGVYYCEGVLLYNDSNFFDAKDKFDKVGNSFEFYKAARYYSEECSLKTKLIELKEKMHNEDELLNELELRESSQLKNEDGTDYSIFVGNLIDKYSQNRLNASSSYDNKYFYVTGYVKGIEKNDFWGGDYYLELSSNEYLIVGKVRCFPMWESLLKDINAGDFVKVYGKCLGYDGYFIDFEDCSFEVINEIPVE